MLEVNAETITGFVLDRFADTPDPRLKLIMNGLVRHLHDFAREVSLTEEEWLAAIMFLTATGRKCSATRQEFILLSDTLGLSTLVTAQNNPAHAGTTEPTVLGPFHVANSPLYAHGDDVANGAVGEPCLVSGRVLSLAGEPLAGAEIEVWQADAEGMYDIQRPELEHAQARGRLVSGPDGGFHFRSIVANSYPIPDDGPVGAMLMATNRHPWRPAHLHFIISAPGHKTLTTHIFRKGDRYLESDAVFGVRSSLIADWTKDGQGVYHLDHDFVLNPAH